MAKVPKAAKKAVSPAGGTSTGVSLLFALEAMVGAIHQKNGIESTAEQRKRQAENLAAAVSGFASVPGSEKARKAASMKLVEAIRSIAALPSGSVSGRKNAGKIHYPDCPARHVPFATCICARQARQ